MMAARLPTLAEVIADHGGYLCSGMGDVHAPNGPLCALQAHSIAMGLPEITDDPGANRTWDIRALNDMPVAAPLRTEWMPRVMAAYEGALDWPAERQIAVAGRLVLQIIRELVPKIPELSRRERATCRSAGDLASAKDAVSTILTSSRVPGISHRLRAALTAINADISTSTTGQIVAAAARATRWIDDLASNVTYPQICRLWIEAAAT